MSFPQTVDITRQQMALASVPGLDTGAWFQDVLFKALFLTGMINGVVSDSPPSDTRLMWYQVANPPSGAPGIPQVYDSVAEVWVPLTPAQFINYLSIQPRSKQFVQAAAPTTQQNPQAGDWWLCTTDLRYSVYVTVAPNVLVWFDMSGATLDGATVAALASKTAATVATLPSVGSVPSGSAAYYVTDANATTLGSIVAGGGSNKVPVFSDGTNWRIG